MLRQLQENEIFQTFMNKIGKPLFDFGQKLSTETLPHFAAKFMPEKLANAATGFGSTAVGGLVTAAAGLVAVQTPITMMIMFSMASLTALPVAIATTLAVGAGATALAFMGAGAAYGGTKTLGLVRTPVGAAPATFDGVGASPADFDPAQDFVGAAPANGNKRFATVTTAPEGKTTFGEGLDAKDSFTRAKNGTPKAEDQKIPANGTAPAKKYQPKPPQG